MWKPEHRRAADRHGLRYPSDLSDDEWAQLYARAREMLAHKYASEVVTIADDQSIPPDSRRVMCDSRKWAAAWLLPKVYNDRLIVARHDANPVRTSVVDYSNAPVTIEHEAAPPLRQIGPKAA